MSSGEEKKDTKFLVVVILFFANILLGFGTVLHEKALAGQWPVTWCYTVNK